MAIGSIRAVNHADAFRICEIYNHHVEQTIVTFEEQTVSVSEMESRFERILKEYPYFVYEVDGEVVAYAYADKWRARSAYRLTAETTIYVAAAWHGKGIGRELYAVLLDALKDRGFHVAIGVIGLPNEGSEILHRKMGFERTGLFKEAGRKFDNWVDVSFWSKTLT